MIDEYQEFCTKDEDGNDISEEEAKAKYINLLQKRQKIFTTLAGRLVLSQFIVLCVYTAIALIINNYHIPFSIAGTLIALLIFYAFDSWKRASMYKKLIKRVKNGEIDAMKRLRSIEERYARRSQNSNHG